MVGGGGGMLVRVIVVSNLTRPLLGHLLRVELRGEILSLQLLLWFVSCIFMQ